MPTCVTEGSYNILFITAVVVGMIFLVSNAYFYDKFNKSTTNRLSQKESDMAKNISVFTLIVSILALAVLFVLFFAYNKRMVGVYTTVPSSMAMSPHPSMM